MKYSAAIAVLSVLLRISISAGAVTAPSAVGNVNSTIDVVPQNYTDAEGTLLQGFLSTPDESGKYPAVIILHDSSGPDDYEKQRATLVAKTENYVGFAADIYGLADRPQPGAGWAATQALTGKISGNATLFSMRTQAAIDYVQNLDEVDETKVAIIGYCLGGTGVVHYLNTNGETVAGRTPIVGAIAVHPSLMQWPGPTGKIEIPSLFLTGGDDFLTGPQAMAKLEGDMTSVASDDDVTTWDTIRYAKIQHAFSNWMAENYDERADARSWHSAMTFVKEEFGLAEDYETEMQAPSEANVVAVSYYDGDYPLNGYVSMPESMKEGQLLPAVVILPHKMDATGPSEYEQLLATKIASDTGYIVFVADIYSTDLQDMESSELEENLHANATNYSSRINAALDAVVSQTDGVDTNKLALIGFSFGGSGALYYAMMDEIDPSVKVIASFGGQLDHVANATTTLVSAESGASWGATDGGGSGESWSAESVEPGTPTGGGSWTGGKTEGSDSWGADGGQRRLDGEENGDVGKPQILIQSGVTADSMEDIIKIEETLMRMTANYELTRFSGTRERFTVWDDDDYNPRSTARSMDQLYSALAEVFTFTESSTDTSDQAPTFNPTPAPTLLPTTAPTTLAPTESSSFKSASSLASAFFTSVIVGALLF